MGFGVGAYNSPESCRRRRFVARGETGLCERGRDLAGGWCWR
jgi:hypothetical protein